MYRTVPVAVLIMPAGRDDDRLLLIVPAGRGCQRLALIDNAWLHATLHCTSLMNLGRRDGSRRRHDQGCIVSTLTTNVAVTRSIEHLPNLAIFIVRPYQIR